MTIKIGIYKHYSRPKGPQGPRERKAYIPLCGIYHGMQTQTQDLELEMEIVYRLWDSENVRRVVNNNFIVLKSIVHNALKAVGPIDIEHFYDYFDDHELDTRSQDTLLYSLIDVLSKFAIENDEITMDAFLGDIVSRLNEVLDYVRKNPHDPEAIDYAYQLLHDLQEIDTKMAKDYETKLQSLMQKCITYQWGIMCQS
jgi:hypothetical protein